MSNDWLKSPIPISRTWRVDDSLLGQLSNPRQHLPKRNMSEDLLAVHCIVADRNVFYCDEERIYAFDFLTGKPTWPSENRAAGEIYRTNLASLAQREIALNQPFEIEIKSDEAQAKIPENAQVYRATGKGAQFTLTVQGNLLLAKLGSPVTISARHHNTAYPTQLVCLDLERQGIEVWSIKPPGERWSFEGTPVTDQQNVYAVLRYNDIRPQVHVACYDLRTGTQPLAKNDLRR